MPFIPVATVTQTLTPWVISFSEDGSSLSNWTQDSGSWSVSQNSFLVNTTSGTEARLKLNTDQKSSLGTIAVYQVDIAIQSSGLVNNSFAGLLWYWSGSGSGGPVVELIYTSAGAVHNVRSEFDAVSGLIPAFLPSTSWVEDVYITLKLVIVGASYEIWLAQNLIASGILWNAVDARGLLTKTFVGLCANNCNANFKNIKLSYLPMP